MSIERKSVIWPQPLVEQSQFHRTKWQSYRSSIGLYLGLVFSMVLVYLLMVVNFQSWTEPFIIITALPCALAGIVWMLFITGTTLSVPALMGAIMCMGVATATACWSSLLPMRFGRPPQQPRTHVIIQDLSGSDP
jgi:uncharacterized membrane protein